MTSDKIAIISFYSFVNISAPSVHLAKLMAIGLRKGIKGTVILATEGFNGSISGELENAKFLLNEITKAYAAIDVNVKINYVQFQVFHKLKIKVKKEIIALGIGQLDVVRLRGKYIETKDWDKFISREDVITIDTRNFYESNIGTFKRAILSNTKTFREFPAWVEANKNILQGKKIAMKCTGGIRCEKSTAYLKSIGFDEVYHLRGGILQYLEDTSNENKMWQGECFVFDDRGAVSVDLSPAKSHWFIQNS